MIWLTLCFSYCDRRLFLFRLFSNHYSVIFSKVNYVVQAFYSKLLESVLPFSSTQAQVLPVSIDAVVASFKKLKSNSVDIDLSSVYRLKVNCLSFFPFIVAFPNVYLLFSCS